ncbi:hypothetical protein ACRRTK_010173 [Alexandromys fortis]
MACTNRKQNDELEKFPLNHLAQQLTELEQKLAVAKNELEKAALDRSHPIKSITDVASAQNNCFQDSRFEDKKQDYNKKQSTVKKYKQIQLKGSKNDNKAYEGVRVMKKKMVKGVRNLKIHHTQSPEDDVSERMPLQWSGVRVDLSPSEGIFTNRKYARALWMQYRPQQVEGSPCLVKHEEGPQRNLTAESEPATQELQMSPCPECEEKTDPEKQPAGFDVNNKELILVQHKGPGFPFSDGGCQLQFAFAIVLEDFGLN